MNKKYTKKYLFNIKKVLTYLKYVSCLIFLTYNGSNFFTYPTNASSNAPIKTSDIPETSDIPNIPPQDNTTTIQKKSISNKEEEDEKEEIKYNDYNKETKIENINIYEEENEEEENEDEEFKNKKYEKTKEINKSITEQVIPEQIVTEQLPTQEIHFKPIYIQKKQPSKEAISIIKEELPKTPQQKIFKIDKILTEKKDKTNVNQSEIIPQKHNISENKKEIKKLTIIENTNKLKNIDWFNITKSEEDINDKKEEQIEIPDQINKLFDEIQNYSGFDYNSASILHNINSFSWINNFINIDSNKLSEQQKRIKFLLTKSLSDGLIDEFFVNNKSIIYKIRQSLHKQNISLLDIVTYVYQCWVYFYVRIWNETGMLKFNPTPDVLDEHIQQLENTYNVNIVDMSDIKINDFFPDVNEWIKKENYVSNYVDSVMSNLRNANIIVNDFLYADLIKNSTNDDDNECFILSALHNLFGIMENIENNFDINSLDSSILDRSEVYSVINLYNSCLKFKKNVIELSTERLNNFNNKLLNIDSNNIQTIINKFIIAVLDQSTKKVVQQFCDKNQKNLSNKKIDIKSMYDLCLKILQVLKFGKSYGITLKFESSKEQICSLVFKLLYYIFKFVYFNTDNEELPFMNKDILNFINTVESYSNMESQLPPISFNVDDYVTGYDPDFFNYFESSIHSCLKNINLAKTSIDKTYWNDTVFNEKEKLLREYITTMNKAEEKINEDNKKKIEEELIKEFEERKKIEERKKRAEEETLRIQKEEEEKKKRAEEEALRIQKEEEEKKKREKEEESRKQKEEEKQKQQILENLKNMKMKEATSFTDGDIAKVTFSENSFDNFYKNLSMGLNNFNKKVLDDYLYKKYFLEYLLEQNLNMFQFLNDRGTMRNGMFEKSFITQYQPKFFDIYYNISEILSVMMDLFYNSTSKNKEPFTLSEPGFINLLKFLNLFDFMFAANSKDLGEAKNNFQDETIFSAYRRYKADMNNSTDTKSFYNFILRYFITNMSCKAFQFYTYKLMQKNKIYGNNSTFYKKFIGKGAASPDIDELKNKIFQENMFYIDVENKETEDNISKKLFENVDSPVLSKKEIYCNFILRNIELFDSLILKMSNDFTSNELNEMFLNKTVVNKKFGKGIDDDINTSKKIDNDVSKTAFMTGSSIPGKKDLLSININKNKPQNKINMPTKIIPSMKKDAHKTSSLAPSKDTKPKFTSLNLKPKDVKIKIDYSMLPKKVQLRLHQIRNDFVFLYINLLYNENPDVIDQIYAIVQNYVQFIMDMILCRMNKQQSEKADAAATSENSSMRYSMTKNDKGDLITILDNVRSNISSFMNEFYYIPFDKYIKACKNQINDNIISGKVGVPNVNELENQLNKRFNSTWLRMIQDKDNNNWLNNVTKPIVNEFLNNNQVNNKSYGNSLDLTKLNFEDNNLSFKSVDTGNTIKDDLNNIDKVTDKMRKEVFSTYYSNINRIINIRSDILLTGPEELYTNLSPNQKYEINKYIYITWYLILFNESKFQNLLTEAKGDKTKNKVKKIISFISILKKTFINSMNTILSKSKTSLITEDFFKQKKSLQQLIDAVKNSASSKDKTKINEPSSLLLTEPITLANFVSEFYKQFDTNVNQGLFQQLATNEKLDQLDIYKEFVNYLTEIREDIIRNDFEQVVSKDKDNIDALLTKYSIKKYMLSYHLNGDNDPSLNDTFYNNIFYDLNEDGSINSLSSLVNSVHKNMYKNNYFIPSIYLLLLSYAPDDYEDYVLPLMKAQEDEKEEKKEKKKEKKKENIIEMDDEKI